MESNQKKHNLVHVIENYLIVLLGVLDKQIPSSIHLQKEIFVLSKAVPKIGEYVAYEKHYLGPYSVDLANIASDPVFYPNAFSSKNNSYEITDEGKKIFEKIVESNKNNDKFTEFLALAKMVREMYDGLTQDELLFLIYITYGEYTEYSSVSDRLLSSAKRKELSRKLFNKGMITESRYRELVNNI